MASRLREALASNMKARRRFLDLTQAELASRAGLSAGYIGEIELAHKYPGPEILERLASVLDTPPYRLVMTEADLAEEGELAGRSLALDSMLRLRDRLDREIRDIFANEAPRPGEIAAEAPEAPRAPPERHLP